MTVRMGRNIRDAARPLSLAKLHCNVAMLHRNRRVAGLSNQL
jgi:hypothetical protein